MTDSTRSGFGMSLVIGIILVGIGVIFLLDNLFDFNLFFDLFDFWPLILIFLGASRLLSGQKEGQLFSYILIGVGVLFLLDNLNIVYIDEVIELWPLILILIGIRIIYQHSKAKEIPGPGVMGEEGVVANRISSGAFFGGKTLRVNSESFEGGEVTSVFGGSEIYFGKSQLAPNGAVLMLTAIFGAVEIYVPPHWQVVTRGTPIFGGYEDERQRVPESHSSTDPILEIRGTVLFGGVEIKNDLTSF